MWVPRKPETLEEAKLSAYHVRDSVLKILFTRGATRGIYFSRTLKLPYALIDPELKHLRENDLITPVGGSGVGGYEGMDFSLTQKGRELADGAMRSSAYIGPAPVSIEDYTEAITAQKFHARWVKQSHLEAAFKDIVVSPEYLDQLGPAINSGGPIFLYGKPGNGKTTISERLARIFRQGMFIPHAIQVDGEIIQLLDEKVHRPFPDPHIPDDHPIKSDPGSLDARWVFVIRPFIIVGGELTLEMLDLTFREGQKCYEAPFQLKANGGVLLVDDFGRQIVRPKDFLNRWIFPLEKNVDFLTLVNGRKVEVPFEQILIFSTNLNPDDLADEAFWRRIRYKIEIPSPTEPEYRKIFEAACRARKITFDEGAYSHLIQKHYLEPKRPLRAVHPRDILGHAMDHIHYKGFPPKLTPELMDRVCTLYFNGMETGQNSTDWADSDAA